MSTAFFWDEKQKKFICERRAWNGDFKGRGQYLFVFNSVQDFIELMNFVVFCFEYWSNEE